MDTRKIKKLMTLEQEPNLVFFDEIQSLKGKLEAIQGSLVNINTKEYKTYESELNSLLEAISSLTRSVIDKDTIVNIPLDQLASQIKAVEVAIKDIKEVKIPEFPTEMSLNEDQINALLLEIQAIPPFPIKDLEKMVEGLGKKIEAIKFEQNEFDYDFLRDKFEKLIKAVKGINIVVGGGGGIGERANTNLDTIASNTLLSSNIEGLGSVTIGTTAVELTFTGVTKSIILSASQSNTGIIYIGKSNVTNLGANALTFLMPGESLTLDYNDTDNALYAVSDTAAQSLFKGSLL